MKIKRIVGNLNQFAQTLRVCNTITFSRFLGAVLPMIVTGKHCAGEIFMERNYRLGNLNWVMKRIIWKKFYFV